MYKFGSWGFGFSIRKNGFGFNSEHDLKLKSVVFCKISTEPPTTT